MTPDEKRLFQIFHPHAADKQTAAFSNGGIRFVYYTRAETATRILKNKQIWMRKSMCMNDFSEVDYGLSCLNEAFRSNDAGKRFISALDSLFDGLGLEITKLFDSWTWHLRTDSYLTCVSEHKVEEDILGRLSMWRAYGGTNGVALVMNNAAFQADEPSNVLKIYGSPVAYLEPATFFDEFRKVITNIENNAEFLRQQGRQEVGNRVFRMLAFAALCIKHPGFKEELEWRVIHCPWWQDSPHTLKEVEIIGGTPQVVSKIPLKDIPEEDLSGMTIPALIDRIIIGPCKYPRSTFEAFVRLLKEAGVTEPEKRIFVSHIPLRQ